MGIDNHNTYIAGQRWVSMSEPELGLGLVVQVEIRQVQLFFPGSGETRTYAIDIAPLKRVHFAPGDTVRGHDGDELTVVSVQERDGLFTYIGSDNSLEESSLCDSLSFDDPESRLLSGHVDKTDLFELRLATHHHHTNLQTSPVRGLTGARIELLPHQMYIAHEVSKRQIPRVLLADEVGLGKTIEACLILHRMLVCGLVQRALVLVPDALVHQWFVELFRRFNITFSIVSEDQFDDPSYNPFLEDQLVLCGIDSLVQSPLRAKQAKAAAWDILVVDEAHHLKWAKDDVSEEYQLVEEFASSVPGLLLLTASPEQAGIAGHFARLRLLDPARYPDFNKFMEEHDTYVETAAKAETLLEGKSEDELHDLLDRHGPGRVMFRNTRAAMTLFPKRIPHLVPLKAQKEDSDPRAEWLADFLRKAPDRKVFVVCKSASEVAELYEDLHALISVEIAKFHESLPLLQCDRQAAWFAEPDGARVLISSGIGGEGRNFQFVSHMVLMDVPADPESVEQRIGRLDRIGQKRDIHIHVPYIEGSREENIVRWLHEGLDAFATPMVGGYRMLNEFGDRLDKVTDELIAETRQRHDALSREIAEGRDRLLELNSCRPSIAADLVDMVEKADDDDALERYMTEVYEQFGVGIEKLGVNDYLLRPHMLYCEEFPLPKDSMRITYDRRYALERPIVTLLSWDHPMIHSVIDLILGTDRGSCTVSRSSAISKRVMQTVYVLEAVSAHRTAVSRFLPVTPIVVQVDDEMELMADVPEVEGDGDSWMVLDDLDFRNDCFPKMLAASRDSAENQAEGIKELSLTAMRKELGEELRRLKDLQAINDHIRPEEVTAVMEQIEEFDAAIANARIRLDAIRLIIPDES